MFTEFLGVSSRENLCVDFNEMIFRKLSTRAVFQKASVPLLELKRKSKCCQSSFKKCIKFEIVFMFVFQLWPIESWMEYKMCTFNCISAKLIYRMPGLTLISFLLLFVFFTRKVMSSDESPVAPLLCLLSLWPMPGAGSQCWCVQVKVFCLLPATASRGQPQRRAPPPPTIFSQVK